MHTVAFVTPDAYLAPVSSQHYEDPSCPVAMHALHWRAAALGQVPTGAAGCRMQQALYTSAQVPSISFIGAYTLFYGVHTLALSIRV